MFEGDVLRTELSVEGGASPLRRAAAASSTCARVVQRRARRTRRDAEPVLDWRFVGGDGLSEGVRVTGILDGMRVVEGSAFVAAPLGGMTLAQLGADVIRFDPIGGGLDRNRWPRDRRTARACSGPA